MAMWLSACAAAKPPEAVSAPVAQSAPRPATHIYVTEESLDNACYKEVGEVNYVEPFAAAATDPEHLGMADELRAAAVKKYPNRVDAIINVHTDDHDIGSEVLVSGEAVQLEPPSKIDCKLPDKIAAALVNFATGSQARSDRRGATSGVAYNGPAGTTNTASEADGGSSGLDATKHIRENLRRAMVATMPGQTHVNESALADQAQLQQAEIRRLRTEIRQMVNQRCEAADLSDAECDSMRKNAGLEQHEVVAVPDKGAGDNSPSVFEIRNLIQAQDEQIEKLRRQVADMNEIPHEAAGANPPTNSTSH